MGLVFSVSTLAQTAIAADQLEVTFINVGQGDGTLIKCPGADENKYILVDLGTSKYSDPKAVNDGLLKILQAIPNQEIDTLVLTHADVDHYRMVPSKLKEFNINRVVYGGKRNDYSFGNVFKFLKETKGVAGIEYLGDSYSEYSETMNKIDCGDARINILAANAPAQHFSDIAWKKNTASIVLSLQYGSHSLLLAGDATCETENFILNNRLVEGGEYNESPSKRARTIMSARTARMQSSVGHLKIGDSETVGTRCREAKLSDNQYVDLRSSLLRVGHHGSNKTSTQSAWLEAIEPKIAMISAGAKHDHPSCEVIDRLKSRFFIANSETVSHSVPCFRTNGKETELVSESTNKPIFSTAAIIEDKGTITKPSYRVTTGKSYKFVVTKDGIGGSNATLSDLNDSSVLVSM